MIERYGVRARVREARGMLVAGLVAVLATLALGACAIARPQLIPPAGTAAARASAANPAVTTTPRAPAAVAEGIHWRAWEPATFALAQAQDKLILLDLTAVWCHWCHVMDTTTYADPTVIELVNASYVAIRVDTDQRPDVTARYIAGGWPTTAILSSTGETVVAYTYVPPEALISLLQEASALWAQNRELITANAAELRRQQTVNQPEPAAGVPTDTVKYALARLAGNYDDVNGGFGRQPKFLAPGAIELMLRTNRVARDPVWQERVTRTLAGAGRLVDPVWGGVYRYSVTADWQTPHYEKMLDGNAEALRTYLEAYQATGNVAYRKTAEAILRYVARFLSDPAGGFYGSQDADLYRRDSSQILMAGEEYFTLAEKERAAAGMPHVDQTIYANWNGQMITALLQAAAALDQPRYRDMALKTLDRLWSEGRGAQGQMQHSLGAGAGALNDQTRVGLAFLAAYSATGRHDYLAHAEELGQYVLGALRDPATGAFYDVPADPAAVGKLADRQTPCLDNVVAARFFTRLYRHTDQPTYRAAAESALRLCATTLGDNADYALAADDLLTYPLTLVVVGTPGQPKVDALLATAVRFYWPGKVVTPLDPALGAPTLGELSYPPDRIAIYACSAGRCSAPVESPKDLAGQVAWLFSNGQ